jgi:transcriptional regulator with XRE-family HTH domain
MSWVRLGRQMRAIRLRSRLRQTDVARLAHVSRSAVSLIELGRAERLSVRVVESVVAGLGARLDARLLWHGPELDRLMDAAHSLTRLGTAFVDSRHRNVSTANHPIAWHKSPPNAALVARTAGSEGHGSGGRATSVYFGALPQSHTRGSRAPA